MPSAPALFRATTIVILSAAGLAACGGVVGLNPPSSPEAPSPAAVVTARFASSVDLDHGGLLIAPPPVGARATVTETEASAMFDATDAVQGPHAFSILGLGIVTVATRDERSPASTTTAPPPPSSTVPTTTAPPPPAPTTTTPTTTTPTTTTPTTTAPPTTTTAPTTTVPSGTPASSAPSTTLPTAPAPSLPIYRGRLAWVGIAWGAPETCPGSTTTQAPSAGTPTYVAVLIDARTGHQVLAYRSGGPSPCGGAPAAPAVTAPSELVSVPWQPVGPASTAVQIQIPPCGRYYGWTQMPTTGTGIADQVVVAVPFDPSCGATAAQSQLIDQVIPLGPGQALVGHAAVGPIQALRVLPTT
ncbi:MAG TPA: hypothetical protein VID75_14765 [Acidimicrobiales bacterium]